MPPGTRQIPMLFGGHTPAAMNRMARWGEGFIAPSVPAAMAAPAFDYYSVGGGDEFASMVSGALCDSPAKVKEKIASFADIGIEEISFNTGTDDLDEVRRLADIVL